MAGRVDCRSPVCDAIAEVGAGVCRGGDPFTGARDRREHGDLQHHQRGDAQVTAGEPPRRVGGGRPQHQRERVHESAVGGDSRPAGHVQRDLRIRFGQLQLDERRRSTARRRELGERGLFRRVRRQANCRPADQARRRLSRMPGRRCVEQRLLAAAVLRGRKRHRQDHLVRRSSVRDHRSHRRPFFRRQRRRAATVLRADLLGEDHSRREQPARSPQQLVSPDHRTAEARPNDKPAGGSLRDAGSGDHRNHVAPRLAHGGDSAVQTRGIQCRTGGERSLLPANRIQEGIVRSHGDRRTRAAHCLRERCQPLAGARHREAARDGGAPRPRRGARPVGETIDHGEPAPFDARRDARDRLRPLGEPGAR